MSASPNRPHKVRPRHNRPGWGTRRAQPCPLLVVSSKSICVRRQHGNSEPSDTNTTRVPWPTHGMSVECGIRRAQARPPLRYTRHTRHARGSAPISSRHDVVATCWTTLYGPAVATETPNPANTRVRGVGVGGGIERREAGMPPWSGFDDDVACWDTWGPSGSVWSRSIVCGQSNTRWTYQCHCLNQPGRAGWSVEFCLIKNLVISGPCQAGSAHSAQKKITTHQMVL